MSTRRAVAVLASLALLGTALGGSPAAAAPKAPVAQPARHRFIVKTESSTATPVVAQTVRSTGGQVRDVYSRALTGLSASLTAAEAEALRGDTQVESVTADRLFHSTAVQSDPTWGLDRIDQHPGARNGTYRYQTTGAGVTAFVVDTGIRLNHEQFGGRASSGYNFADDDQDATDCEGHGTHVSGTIGGRTWGAAKSVQLVSVKVLDCDGGGWATDIIDGMDWIIAHKPKGPAVVNMSIGGEAYPLLDKAVERTVAAGISVVVAAGNDGANACGSSPARAPRAITVAATDTRDTRPSWSNYGRCVDIFAPGVGVRSASFTSNRASEVLSGTSMATPHVTGLVARYLQAHPKATPAATASALVDSATLNVVQGASGSPNRLLYATPPVSPPGVPTKVTVSKNDTAKTATIAWSAPRDNGGRAVTSYQVWESVEGSEGVRPTVVSVAASARKRTFTGLKKGAAYRLSVRAVNSVGTSSAVTKKVATLR